MNWLGHMCCDEKTKKRNKVIILLIAGGLVIVLVFAVSAGLTMVCDKIEKINKEIREREKKEVVEREERNIERDKENIEGLYSDVRLLMKEKKWSEAEKLLKRISAVESDYLDVTKLTKKVKDKLVREYSARGAEHYKRKSYTLAAKEYRRAFELCPYSTKIQHKLIKIRNKLINQELKAERKKKAEDMRSYYANKVDIAVQEVKEKSVIFSSYGYSNYPDSGKKFVLINSYVINGSKLTHHANPNNFTLVDSGGFSYHYDSATHSLDNSFPAVNLIPGTKTTGWLVFQIKSSNEPKRLIYSGFGVKAEKKIVRTE